MDRVKIYSKYDLTTNMNINNIINFTNNFNYEIEEYNINDVLEYFNIIKFSKDNEIKERIINETNKKFDEVLKIIQRRIGKFNGKNKESFLSLYNEVDFIYREDFFELIKRDDILNNIKDLDFEELLNNPNFHYNLILKHEKIVKKFDEIITKYMIEDSECAEIIIGKYIYEKNPFNINEVVMFDGKLENSELKGCTKLEKIEYIKEIPAPGILIFGTLYVLFLCMGWIKVTDFVLFMISFVIIIMIDRRSTLRRGTKKIKKYIQKFNRE